MFQAIVLLFSDALFQYKTKQLSVRKVLIVLFYKKTMTSYFSSTFCFKLFEHKIK